MSDDSEQTVRVLMVEDNPADVRLIQQLLRRASPGGFEVCSAETLCDGLRQLQERPFDLVLLDLGLPDSFGLAAVEDLVHHHPEVPIVVLTGLDDANTALQAMRRGVQDYWVKSEIEGRLLVKTLRYAIERHRLLLTLDETRQQQTRLEEQFLSHVSHELRSPLTSVHQFASILLDGLGGPLTAEQRQYLEVVLRNALQLRSMIEELLDVTRAESGKLGLDRGGVDLQQIMRNILVDARPGTEAKSLCLRSQVPRLPLVYVDPCRVAQVLSNLLDNAIKFTPQGGAVTLRAKLVQDGEFVCVEVSDNGCGIPPETLPHIFDRLYQGKEAMDSSRKGLGLGLYICRELVTRQGGRIWAESQSGQGTAVFFTLPVFSLDSLLQPLLADKQALRADLQLVEVVLTPAAESQRDAWDHARRQARWVIQRCVLPDRDLLIPFIGNCERRECVHVFACADETGARVLTKRIGEQLLRSPQIAPALHFRVSAAAFRPPLARAGETYAQWRKRLAGQLFQTVLHRSEEIHHEEAQDSDRRRRPRSAARLARASAR